MCFVCSPSQQSPIHIVDEHVYPTKFPTKGQTAGLVPPKKPKKEGKLKRKGDQPFYYVAFPPGNGCTIKLNSQTFHLVEFHFHESSEHWINKKQYSMELHIVFQNGDGRAVLGIMLDVLDNATRKSESARVNLVDSSCMPEENDVDSAEEALIAKALEINPAKWLPETEFYYRYEGSLTTPTFDENVRWVVFKKPLLLPGSAIDFLRTHFGLSARIPQPLNRRFILSSC